MAKAASRATACCPVRGWHLLLAKDAAFLAALLPLDAAACARCRNRRRADGARRRPRPAVEHPRDQTRWRFTTGRRSRQRPRPIGGHRDDGVLGLFEQSLVPGSRGGGVGSVVVVVWTGVAEGAVGSPAYHPETGVSPFPPPPPTPELPPRAPAAPRRPTRYIHPTRSHPPLPPDEYRHYPDTPAACGRARKR